MSQEASLIPDLSTRAAQEYSDLFAVSGTSFLNPIDHTSTILSSSVESSAFLLPSSSDLKPDQSALIDFVSETPLPARRVYHSNSATRSDKLTIKSLYDENLIDRSISSFDLLPKALSPFSPSSRTNQPSRHRTPPTSPTRAHQILSTPIPLRHGSPSKAESSSSGGSHLTRTQSVDLLGLYDNPTPRFTISRSKSTTAIPRGDGQNLPSSKVDNCRQSKVTRSILKRPNSPSKGARARFFNPRTISALTEDDRSFGSDSCWVDENGNLKAREIIHEFQKDQPPMSRPSSLARPSPRANTFTPRSKASYTSSSSIRRHHLPKFTVPEPIDLGIEPILPRQSTSPSPSPPSLPPSSYLMNLKDRRKSASTTSVELDRASFRSAPRSCSNSLVFNLGDENLPNILDESGGFLVEDETTLLGETRESTTELSIDLNHVAMMKILGKHSHHRAGTLSGSCFSKRNSENMQCGIPEEEESVDVFGLATQLEKNSRSDPSANLALKDEQAPHNLRGSQDGSTTFEISGIDLPPLLTDQNELWKNSKPKHKVKNVSDKSLGSSRISGTTSNPTSSSACTPVDCEVSDNDTLSLKKKVGPTKITSSPYDAPGFVTPDDLFSELMADPLLSSAFPTDTYSPLYSANDINPPLKPLSNTRPLSVHKKASVTGGEVLPSKPITANKTASTVCISKPRPSSQSISIAPPLGRKRPSNIGVGLPSSTLAAGGKLNAIAATIARTKLKPSTAVKGVSSPKMMKSRSSLSTQIMHSPKLRSKGSPSSKILTRGSLSTTTHLPAPRSYPPTTLAGGTTSASNYHSRKSAASSDPSPSSSVIGPVDGRPGSMKPSRTQASSFSCPSSSRLSLVAPSCPSRGEPKRVL